MPAISSWATAVFQPALGGPNLGGPNLWGSNGVTALVRQYLHLKRCIKKGASGIFVVLVKICGRRQPVGLVIVAEQMNHLSVRGAGFCIYAKADRVQSFFSSSD